MSRIEESVVINRPVDQVYAYVTDPKNLPQWESASLEAEQTSPGQAGIGTTSRGVNKVMGRRMEWYSIVKECEPNKRWGETINSGSTRIEEHLLFDTVKEGTEFTLIYDMEVGGLLKLFTPMVANTMRKQTKGNLSNLKSILEAQT